MWYLLTTLPIEAMDDIEHIITAHLARWDIELLFRTFKSGCKVENRSLRKVERMYPMFSLFLIVAWRINMLVQVARSHPDLPCTGFFSDIEWRSALAATSKTMAPPEQIPTIKEMLSMVTKLGGYLNRKNDPDPGANGARLRCRA